MDNKQDIVTRDMWIQCRERCDERCQTCDGELGDLKKMCGKNTEDIRELQNATQANNGILANFTKIVTIVFNLAMAIGLAWIIHLLQLN